MQEIPTVWLLGYLKMSVGQVTTGLDIFSALCLKILSPMSSHGPLLRQHTKVQVEIAKMSAFPNITKDA